MLGKDKQLIFIWVILIVLGAIAGMYYIQTEGISLGKTPLAKNVSSQPSVKYPNNLVIKSKVFENNGIIPEKYTCKEENISPPLEFLEVPSGAQSLVLVVTDPDAPLKDFIHWLVFNIDPKTINVAENSIPGNGLQGQNSLGKGEYTGPCPATGTHRYVFELYALNTRIDDSQTYTKEQILQRYKENILDTAKLTGLFGNN